MGDCILRMRRLRVCLHMRFSFMLSERHLGGLRTHLKNSPIIQSYQGMFFASGFSRVAQGVN